DHVIVINAEKIVLTGKKETDKIYRHHSLYPGGLSERQARFIRAEKPERMIEEAVQGMLPKSKLGRKMLKKLKVYRGTAHPHKAQQPETLEVSGQVR
ncbi:MAG: ribosomal protein, partial [Acidobacteria bacterium]|nr:ribosomal protein [Acidobacteriota bacterium]